MIGLKIFFFATTCTIYLSIYLSNIYISIYIYLFIYQYHLSFAGQSKIQQGFLKDGYELISEALNLLNNVYGAMHPEIAQCLRMLARLVIYILDGSQTM